MQLALIGSALISDREALVPSLDILGLKLGQNFQLMDDLCELTEDVQGHELEANPFLHFKADDLLETIQSFHNEIKDICQLSDLKSLERFIAGFERNVFQKLEAGKAKIQQTIDIDPSKWSFLNAN